MNLPGTFPSPRPEPAGDTHPDPVATDAPGETPPGVPRPRHGGALLTS